MAKYKKFLQQLHNAIYDGEVVSKKKYFYYNDKSHKDEYIWFIILSPKATAQSFDLTFY